MNKNEQKWTRCEHVEHAFSGLDYCLCFSQAKLCWLNMTVYSLWRIKKIKVASYLNTELHRLGQAIAKYKLPYTKILNKKTIFLILTNFNTFLKI